MKTKLFSPLLTAANNIVKTRRPLTKRAKEYDAFINWLDTSNKDVKKIKLPKVKKVEDLEFSIGSALGGGGGGGGLTNLLLGGAAGLGVRFLGKGIKAVKGFGKNAISKIFPKLAASSAKKAAVPAADITKKGVAKGWEHIATGAPRAVVTGADDAAKIAAMKGGGKLATKGGELASKLIPGLATAVNLSTSAYRFSQGDVVGGSLSLASAIPILGWAAVGVDVAREFGAFEGTSFGLKKEKPKDKINERLKAQEKKQKETASASNVNFTSITDKFDKVVSKFEKIKFGMTGTGPGDKNVGKGEESMNPYQEPEQYPPINPSNQTYDGPISGDTFFPLPGGKAGQAANQQFGADRARGKGSHAGLDMTHHVGALNAPVAAYKTGKVVESVSNGYNGYVTIDHGGGLKTRYYHTSPSVNTGDVVYGGQQIANLYPAGDDTHLHFEVYRGGTAINPSSAGLGQKIPAPLTKEKAKQQSEQSASKGKGSQGMADIRGNTPDTKQQTIEDFEKQTMGKERADRALKDPKLPEFKQLQKNYNVYVKGIRERRQAQIAPGQTPQVPGAITTPLQEQTPGSAILLGQSQPAGQPSMVPVPIPMGGGGGGGGGVAVVSLSEGQILNSLWKTMLLTNLSST
jgi:murein DD-endopeptidase MepM/ murein hydrolase activator NlpD